MSDPAATKRGEAGITKGSVADQEQTHFALQTNLGLTGSNFKLRHRKSNVKVRSDKSLSSGSNMLLFVNKNVVFTLSITFFLYVIALPAHGGDTLVAGKATSNEAAVWSAGPPENETPAATTLALGVLADAAYEPPDTTGFQFPVGENKHLVRDIAVFVIVAAFVGYFLIKVFLEGDTEEEAAPKGGKDVPAGAG